MNGTGKSRRAGGGRRFSGRPHVPAGQADQFIAQFRTPHHQDAHLGIFWCHVSCVRHRSPARPDFVRITRTPQHIIYRFMKGRFGPRQPAGDLKEANATVLVINAKGAIRKVDDEEHICSLSTQTDYRVMKGVGHQLTLKRLTNSTPSPRTCFGSSI